MAVVCSNKHQWPYGNWELSAVADSIHDVHTPLYKKVVTIKLWKKQEASHRELSSFSSGQNMKNRFLKTKTRSRLFVFCRRKVVRKFRYQETFAKELVLKKSVFVNYTSWLQQVKNSQFVQPTWKYTHEESCTFLKKINSTICSSKIHPNIKKMKLVWLVWELGVKLLLKTNVIDTSSPLKMFLIHCLYSSAERQI